MKKTVFFPFLLFIIFFSFHTVKLNAQADFGSGYTPLSRNAPPQNVLDQIKLLNQESPLLKVDKYQKEFKEFNKELEGYFKNKIDSSNYYFDDLINPYIQNIFQTIIKSNPSLNDLNLKLLVSRSPMPNAFAMPNGYIELHLGLLRYLEDESQIANVLSHEIAHVVLRHTIRNLSNYLDFYYSKETQKQLKDIKSSEYNKYSKYTDFTKNLTFNSRKHSREYEFEADSLGLLILSKTPYSITDGSNIFLIFDSIDKEKYKDSLLLDQIFHTENYPFKPRWIKETSFIKSSETHTKEYLDSLKTHPDTDLRYENAQKVIKDIQQANGKKFVQDSSKFFNIRITADFECVSNMYHDEIISYSMYLNLKLLQAYPENKYLRNMFIKNLVKIQEGLENMKLSNYVAKPNPFNTGDYRHLILMLNSLRHSEITPLIEEMKKKYQVQ